MKLLWIVVVLAGGQGGVKPHRPATPVRRAADKPAAHRTAVTSNAGGEGGILYGPGYGYLVSAPPGWVMDDAEGRANQLDAIFYRSGHGGLSAPALIYCRGFATRPKETLIGAWKQDFAEYKREAPQVTVTVVRPLRTAGMETIARFYHHGPRPMQEITYFREAHADVAFVLSCATAAAFHDALPAYKHILNSYAIMNVEFAPAKPAGGPKKPRR